jgi:hypothetical protein
MAAEPAGGAGAAAGAASGMNLENGAVPAEPTKICYCIGDRVHVNFYGQDKADGPQPGKIIGYLVRLDKEYVRHYGIMHQIHTHGVVTGNPKSMTLPSSQWKLNHPRDQFKIEDGDIVSPIQEGGKSRSRTRRRRQHRRRY